MTSQGSHCLGFKVTNNMKIALVTLEQCAVSVWRQLSAWLHSSVGVPPLHHFGAFCLFPTLSGLAPRALREDVEGALGCALLIRLETKTSEPPIGCRLHASATTLHLSVVLNLLFLLDGKLPKDEYNSNAFVCFICGCANAHSGNLKRHIRSNHGVLAPRVCHSTRGARLFNL